jgi:NlpC/P60 family putative phage cell wall peptidase
MRRTEIVAAARAWVGTPYRHRASAPGAGCDCLGLLRGVWRSLYGNEPQPVPNYSADWRRGEGGALQAAAERWLLRAGGSPQAGQVVLFRLGRMVRHCGIVLAPGRFVHAQEGLGVIEANLTEGWADRIAGRYEFPGVERR